MSEETTQAKIVYAEETSPEILEMIDAGVFYGLKKTKTNPEMRQYVLVNRGGIELIDLHKTAEALRNTVGFLDEIVRRGGIALVVATQPAAETAVLGIAKKFHFPYVTNRWPGGAITNFKSISGRIEYFVKLRGDLASGVFNQYTKKERLMLERELGRLRKLFEGLESMTKLPDVLIIIDPVMHRTAIREAKRARIPVIAFANVDTDPSKIDYLVPGNDNAKKSIEWFLSKMERTITEGLSARAIAKQTEEFAKEKEVVKTTDGK